MSWDREGAKEVSLEEAVEPSVKEGCSDHRRGV